MASGCVKIRGDANVTPNCVGNRCYESYLNHFVQPDSIIPDPGDTASYDRFAYSINNPLRYVDPSGHWYCDPKQCGYLHDNDDGSTASPGSPLNDLITWINDYGSQATFADTSWFVEHPDYDPANDAFLNYVEHSILESGESYLGVITLLDISDVRRYYSLVNKSQNFNLWDFLVGAAQEAGPPLLGAVLNSSYGKDAAYITIHHIATDKNTLRGDKWTLQFEALFAKGNMTLDDEANKIGLAGHYGPHSSNYHKMVYDRLSKAILGLTDPDAIAAALRVELTNIGIELANDPGMVNR